MFVLNIVIACALFFFISCKSAYVDTIKKCSKDNNQCLNNLYLDILHQIATPGIPELGIPANDPLVVKNVSLTVIDSITVTIVEGTIKGLKTCNYKNFNTNLDKKTGSVDLICDITMKGHVKFAGSSPLIKNLLGRSNLDGEGSGKIKIDKLHLAITFPYSVVKRDGEVYIYWPSNGIVYKYDAEKLSFTVEKAYIGKDDISELVNAYVKNNEMTLLKNFGKKFIDRAMSRYFKNAEKFVNGVPASKFIIEDLSPYVKN